MTLNIGTPVPSVRKPKVWTEIAHLVKSMPVEQMLPVTCESPEAARTHRKKISEALASAYPAKERHKEGVHVATRIDKDRPNVIEIHKLPGVRRRQAGANVAEKE